MILTIIGRAADLIMWGIAGWQIGDWLKPVFRGRRFRTYEEWLDSRK